VIQFWRERYKIKFTQKLYHRPRNTRFLRNPSAEQTNVLDDCTIMRALYGVWAAGA